MKINDKALNYLKSRNINIDSIKNFNLSSDSSGNIQIPITINNRFIGCKTRKINSSEKPKYINPKGVIKGFFNEKRLTNKKDNETIFITEGELDAISLEQYGFKSVSILTGAHASHDLIIDAVKNNNNIILSFDNDKSGIESLLQISKYIIHDKDIETNIKILVLDQYKDWNELIVKHNDKSDLEIREYIEQKILELSKTPKEFISAFHNYQKYKTIELISVESILKNEDIELEYLIEGLIFKKTINLISGQSGVGKSLLTQVIAGSLSKGNAVFNKFDTLEHKVGFLDRENELTIIKDRFNQIESKPNNLFYIKLKNTFEEHNISELIDLINNLGITVLVIDTLVRFQEGDENNPKDVNKFFRTLRSLLEHLESIIVIHHLKKLNTDQKSTNDSARGSTDIIASVDTHFILEKVKESDLLTFKNVKNRLTKEIDDITLLQINENFINFDYKGNSSDFFELKSKKTRRLILECIEINNYCDFESISKYVKESGGYSQNIVRKILKELIDKKIITLSTDQKKHFYSVNDNSVLIDSILSPQS